MAPNLSPFERVFRIILAWLLVLIALSQPEIGLLEIVVLIASVALILNGLFARCYLWKWLGLNTAQNEIARCNKSLRKRD